jgi:hypothetical protein
MAEEFDPKPGDLVAAYFLDTEYHTGQFHISLFLEHIPADVSYRHYGGIPFCKVLCNDKVRTVSLTCLRHISFLATDEDG